MGNRAIITTEKQYNDNGIGIYLHWNGGRDSVEGFLTYCRLKGYPCNDDYGFARLIQVIGNFFGGASSLGVCRPQCGAGDDNGVYLIGDNWRIVGRREFDGKEQAEYNLAEFVNDVNLSQPDKEQIPERILHALIMDDLAGASYQDKIKLCRPGVHVAIRDDIYGDYKEYDILGIGDCIVNGQDMTGVPFYNFRHHWTPDPLPDNDIDSIKKNPNSYITERKSFCFC